MFGYSAATLCPSVDDRIVSAKAVRRFRCCNLQLLADSSPAVNASHAADRRCSLKGAARPSRNDEPMVPPIPLHVTGVGAGGGT